MFDKVDKITAGILGLCILAVAILAYGKDIGGDAALGFISGICTALISHAAVTVTTNARNSNPAPPPPASPDPSPPNDTNVGV